MHRYFVTLGHWVVLSSSILAGCSSPAANEPELPCDVNAVLTHVCQTCHTSPPLHGAPFPLVTYADTQAPFSAPPTYDNTPTFRVMGDVVAAGVMPEQYPGVSITDAERKVIVDWAANGGHPKPAGATCH